jgi:hypothetical protein
MQMRANSVSPSNMNSKYQKFSEITAVILPNSDSKIMLRSLDCLEAASVQLQLLGNAVDRLSE